MRSDDETWFDALAGHDAPAHAMDAAMQRAIRKAASQLDEGEPDVLAERRLLARLEREGLLQKPQRWRAPRLAQAAVIVLCVGLVVELVRVDPTGEARHSAQDLSVETDVVAQDAAKLSAEEEIAAPAAPPQARAAPQGQPLKSSPAQELAPLMADEQLAGDAPSVERRESFAVPPMPDITVHVDDPTLVWRELLSWVERQQGVVVVSRDDATRRISLHCADVAACDALRAWLHERDTTIPVPQVGQNMSLRLESRR